MIRCFRPKLTSCRSSKKFVSFRVELERPVIFSDKLHDFFIIILHGSV